MYDDANRPPGFKLGNTDPGDGYKYRVRGILQITGKDNYTTFNNFYQKNYDSSVNLVNNPALLANNLKISVIGALWYFDKRVGDIDKNTTTKEVTKKVNGGYKGLVNRKKPIQQNRKKY